MPYDALINRIDKNIYNLIDKDATTLPPNIDNYLLQGDCIFPIIGVYNSRYSRYDIVVNSNILNRITLLQNEITDLTDLILFNNNTIQITLIDITDAYEKTYFDIFSKLHIK